MWEWLFGNRSSLDWSETLWCLDPTEVCSTRMTAVNFRLAAWGLQTWIRHFWCSKIPGLTMRSLRILRLSQYSNPVKMFSCDPFQFTRLLKNGGSCSNLIVKGDLGSSCICFRPEICVNLQRYLISVTPQRTVGTSSYCLVDPTGDSKGGPQDVGEDVGGAFFHPLLQDIVTCSCLRPIQMMEVYCGTAGKSSKVEDSGWCFFYISSNC